MAGERVLIIDADLRRPQVAGYLQLEGSVGLTTVLIGDARLEDVVQPYGNSRMDVLTAGPVPPNPAELLGFDAMRQLVDQAMARYDSVIIDTPPLLPVTDAAVLSDLASGTLLIAGARVVRRPELAAAIASLEQVDARILGVVLNMAQPSDSDRYGYRYSYQYYGSGEAKAPAQPEPVAQVAEPATAGGRRIPARAIRPTR
jgi:capsular exopolysaccharide synthesis family protein